jgi:hypothetical protein
MPDLAGLVVGAGTAIASDRRILRAWRSEPSERPASLATLGASHLNRLFRSDQQPSDWAAAAVSL